MDSLTCGFCNFEAASQVELNHHILHLHSSQTRRHVCTCGETFSHEQQLTSHRQHSCQDEGPSTSQQQPAPRRRKKRQNRATAFSRHLQSNFIFTYQRKDGTTPPPDTDPHEPFEDDDDANNVDPLTMAPRAQPQIEQDVQASLFEHGNLKVHLTSLVRFRRDTPEGTQEIPFHTASRSFIVQNMPVFRKFYQSEMQRMANVIQEFTENGSGWRLHRVVGVQYDIGRYAPIGGGNFIRTPRSIAAKGAILNLDNGNDQNCLRYALALALWARDNPVLVKKAIYPRSVNAIPQRYIKQVTLEHLHPPPYFVEDMDHIEKHDPRLALNVFSMHAEDDAKQIIPIRISSYNYKPDRFMVNLLLLYDGEGRYHYAWIKNINRLMAKTARTSSGKFCVNCQHQMCGKNRRRNFEEHIKTCQIQVIGRLRFPRGPIRFQRVATQKRKGFVAYCDFESALSPPTPPNNTRKRPAPPPPKIYNAKRARLTGASDFERMVREVAFPTSYIPPDNEGKEGSRRAPHEGLGPGGQAPGPQPPRDPTEHPAPSGSVLNRHGLLSYSMVVTAPKPKFNKVFNFCDDHNGRSKVKSKVVDEFYRLKQMIEDYYEQRIESALVMQKLTDEEEAAWKAATECYMCGDPFLDFVSAGISRTKFYNLKREGRLQWKNPHDQDTYVPYALLKGGKVRDHDHDTGLYRGACHRNCNLNFKNLIQTPVFFHNGSRYDNHHLITTLAEESARLEKKQINVIGKTMEKFTTLSWENFEFKDSYNFLATSLDKMVSNVKTKINEHNPPEKVFKHTLNYFRNVYPPDRGFPSEQEKQRLLLRKGVMCYEYITDRNILSEKSLPSREAFTSQLRGGEEISLEDYDHAVEVWNAFRMKSMKDYLNLYCILDTLLLADCFEEFRNMSLQHFELDPVHYHTAPSLAWAAALLTTKVELDVIQDVEMLNFLDRALLGGYSAVHHQYSKANNPGMHDYDKKRPVCTICCLDANNLYGFCMCDYLPTGNFRWIDLKQDDRFRDVKSIQAFPPNGPTSVFLEVDLNYPSTLHEAHNDLPLAPEKIKVTRAHVSSFQTELAEKLGLNLGGEKLVTQLTSKTKMVLHLKNLQQYLRLGLELTKIHRVLEFDQSQWLKPYIEKNIQGRREATCQHMKNFFKLMINSIYGKCVEDVFNYRDIQICLDQKKFDKLIADPRFQRASIHSENFVTVEMKKAIHNMNRPRYVGITILALAKVHLYHFHYDVIKKYFPNTRLLFTDTDSLTYEISHPPEVDIYSVLKKTGCVDFSNFPPDHPHFSNEFELTPGFWKDECHSTCVREFVGLRSKMYSFLYENGGVKSTAKGVQKSYQKHYLNHEEYKRVLFNRSMNHVENINIVTDGHHNLYTVKRSKVGLNPLNDKRYISHHGDSLAFGHYKMGTSAAPIDVF